MDGCIRTRQRESGVTEMKLALGTLAALFSLMGAVGSVARGQALAAAAGQRGMTAGISEQVPAPVDERQVVTLFGNTPRWAEPGRVVGIVAPEVELRRMVLVLKADAGREQELRRFVQRQHEPGSAEFHRWLTPAEFGRRFGATDGELAQVTGWLRSHGFSVEPVSAGRRLIVFSGTVRIPLPAPPTTAACHGGCAYTVLTPPPDDHNPDPPFAPLSFHTTSGI